MWWPDPETQALQDIVRYDYVMLFPYQEEFVEPLKAIKPDLVLLNSANACEVSCEWDEEDVHALPAAWFLTQVGSEITQGISATSTTIHVASLSVSDETTTHALFVPGDTVLIEGESVVVKKVNRKDRTLVVERGFIRPASAHAKGTRIAAHITFWPGTWVMNLSNLSEKATMDSTIGPERWGDYHARHDAKLVSNPHWDGLTIDRADPNQSWLVGGSTARTLDPDQSNTLPENYDAFDASWNQGLRAYESQLRNAVGDDKIIYVNWGMNNHDLLNGNNFEGFPLAEGSSYRGGWSQTMFGPLANIGSYLEWTTQSRTPNFTTIQTYEDDGVPPPDDIHYDNPFAKPDFVPHYQKMRFGLGSALLGDGFFSYEINTNGHGSLGLMWFDEYDNAGAGRGYLGQPLGPAFRVGDNVLGDDLMVGGDFNTQKDLEQWDLSIEEQNEAHAQVVVQRGNTPLPSSSVQIDITKTRGVDWETSFSFGPLPLREGQQYTFQFRAKANANRTAAIWGQQNATPWKECFETPDVMIGEKWREVEIAVVANRTCANAMICFGLGKTTGTVWIDQVRFRAGGRDVWRRDFEGGAVVVNATRQPCEVDLGDVFLKIKGTQVPEVNDGKKVEKVVVPGLDAIVLLRR